MLCCDDEKTRKSSAFPTVQTVCRREEPGSATKTNANVFLCFAGKARATRRRTWTAWEESLETKSSPNCVFMRHKNLYSAK